MAHTNYSIERIEREAVGSSMLLIYLEGVSYPIKYFPEFKRWSYRSDPITPDKVLFLMDHFTVRAIAKK